MSPLRRYLTIAAVEIALAEQGLGLRLPPDMRAFYGRANGMSKDSADDLMFSLWPLEVIVAARVERRVPEPHNMAALAFGDFLIDSHFYALNVSAQGEGSVGVVWPDGSWERLTDDFESFLSRYWSAPESLYMFDRQRAPGA